MGNYKKKTNIDKSFKQTARSLEEINKDYNLACGMLGDRYFRISALQLEVNNLSQQIGQLNIEANNISKIAAAPTEVPTT